MLTPTAKLNLETLTTEDLNSSSAVPASSEDNAACIVGEDLSAREPDSNEHVGNCSSAAASFLSIRCPASRLSTSMNTSAWRSGRRARRAVGRQLCRVYGH